VGLTPTGVEGLDRILLGGFVRGSSVLIEGTPGAGKTNLGLQFICKGILDQGEPGIVVTFEELSHQIIRDAASLGWDLASLIDAGKLKVIPTSPAVFQQEMAGGGGIISEIAREMGAQRILIDSVSHFARLSESATQAREVFNALVNMLRRNGFTSLLTKEVRVRAAEVAAEEVSFEQYASDSAIRLSYDFVDTTRRARYIEVVKARGQRFIPGKHLFDIAEGGVTVFPNFDLDEPADETGSSEPERISSGVPGLDEMLEGGLVRGFTWLVAGPAGLGKKAIGLQFLTEGARVGEPGLYVLLKGGASKLNMLAASLDVGLKQAKGATVEVKGFHPANVNPYRVLEAVIESSEARGVQRVVIDSTRELELAFSDDSLFEQFAYNLASRLYRQGVTTLLLAGAGGPTEPTELAGTVLAGIVDGILGLCYVPSRGEIRQGIYVLKSRGSGHSTDIRPYTISPGGLRVTTRRVTVYD
jgi:circadian clock protein KaiC